MHREIADCANRLIRLLEDCPFDSIVDYVLEEVCNNGMVDSGELDRLADEEDSDYEDLEDDYDAEED